MSICPIGADIQDPGRFIMNFSEVSSVDDPNIFSNMTILLGFPSPFPAVSKSKKLPPNPGLSFCSGGGFVYGGLYEGSKGVAHGELLLVPLTVDSKEGFSSGILGELGLGTKPIGVSGGYEGYYNWSHRSWGGSWLGFAGGPFHGKEGAGVGWGPFSGGVLRDKSGNVGLYGGALIGMGAYGRPSLSGCQH